MFFPKYIFKLNFQNILFIFNLFNLFTRMRHKKELFKNMFNFCTAIFFTAFLVSKNYFLIEKLLKNSF